DQQAALVIDRERHRSADGVEPSLAQPFGGGVEQWGRDREVVDALEESEEADLVGVNFVVQVIVDRRDATDHDAIAFGDEVLGLCVLEERVLAAVEELLDFGLERRDPGAIPPVEAIRQLDECGELGRGLDAPDDRRGGAQLTSIPLPILANASSAKSVCSGVWVAITLVRRRHCEGGTAGGTTGLVNTPAS